MLILSVEHAVAVRVIPPFVGAVDVVSDSCPVEWADSGIFTFKGKDGRFFRAVMTAAHEILAGQHYFLCRVARNVGFSEDDLSAALVVNVIFRQYEV